MKIFLALLLTGLSFSSFSSELSSIELITPLSYQRKSKFTQYVKSKAEAKIGDIINIDVKKKVKDTIAPYANDLQGYFGSRAELDRFVDYVAQDGIYNHLTESVVRNGQTIRVQKITDAGLSSFYGHLGNKLIGKLADKILEKEGVEDPTRRAIWVSKLVEPFNNCMAVSLNAQYDANHCVEALTSSLVPSVGIGIVYELSKSNLSSSLPEKEKQPFLLGQTQLYKTCLTKTKSAPSDVTKCALEAMRTGINKVTDTTLTKTINEKASSVASAQAIKKAVWPTFQTCTQNVGKAKNPLRDQFMSCIDDLVGTTGSHLVNDKISNTKAVTSIMLPAEAKKLAADKSAQFKKCAESQRAKNARKDGMLDIDVCENTITNEVVYTVVSATLKDTANSTAKNDKAASLKLGNEGVAILNECWSNSLAPAAREACLKKTILTFSGKVASLKLNSAVPADMNGRDKLISSSITTLTSCLSNELPSNISEANDLSQKIDGCSSKLTRSVALEVASYQIKDTASDMLTKEQTDKLLSTLVQDQFAKCLGPAPTDELIDKCGDELTLKAAKQITTIGFDKEVNAYLKKSGGPQAFGLTQNDVNLFIKGLNERTQVCLDKKSQSKAMDKVNVCAKTAIKDIAMYFGDLQFKKSVGDMYAGREADRKEVEKKFKLSLTQCLDTKASSDFSISDYTKNLYVCSDKISGSTTLDVGQDQIDSSLNTYLKDRPGQNLSPLREQIRSKVIGDFKKCMSSTPSDKQGRCIDELKREATQTIVLNYGRTETKAQLNADKMPPELKPVEDSLIQCTTTKLAGDALSAHLDECTKQYALKFAKELGTLKLNHLLKSALGSEEFAAQKKNIDEIVAKYASCLDGLKSIKMSEGLTDKLTVCTTGLEDRGTALVRNSLNGWMSTDKKDAATLMLKREFSAFIPCLSVLLPTSPYTPVMDKNVDSILKPVAVMFAQYIEYNPENAKSTLDGVLNKLSTDLQDIASNPKSREELINFLYEHGTLDQFIKSMVQGEVKKAFTMIPEEDVPNDLKEMLLQRQNFEDIFNSPEGEEIKKAVMDKMLRPALIHQADFKVLEPEMVAIKDSVVNVLANSPKFGEQILRTGVQTQINKMSGVKSFFGKMLYGKESFEWEKVRLTEEGKKAEAYIKEHILLPKFKSMQRTPEVEKKIAEEAEELVTNAVKKYKK